MKKLSKTLSLKKFAVGQLSDEQLSSVRGGTSGGFCKTGSTCPNTTGCPTSGCKPVKKK